MCEENRALLLRGGGIEEGKSSMQLRRLRVGLLTGFALAIFAVGTIMTSPGMAPARLVSAARANNGARPVTDYRIRGVKNQWLGIVSNQAHGR